MMNDDAERALQDLIARDAIRECLYRYCRGIDRADADLLATAYWPAASDDHGMFIGTAAEFVRWVVPFQQRTVRSSHLIGNVLIMMEGSAARVESYFHAMATQRSAANELEDLVAAGRYLDRFEQRGAEWRIIERRVVYDWYRRWPSAQVDVHAFGERSHGGAASHEDISYRLMPPSGAA